MISTAQATVTSPLLSPPPPPSTTYFVRASGLNLRTQPSAMARSLGQLARGDSIRVTTLTDSWAQLSSGCWVSRKYIALEEFEWMSIAEKELGVHELPGAAQNPRIVEYLASTSLGHDLASQDETPWCSGFANFCVEKAGYAGTDSASALSWLEWGRPCQRERRGVIAVFRRKGGHHVAFCSESSDTHQPGAGMRVLGGNQSDGVCVKPYPRVDLIALREP
jgi:uncharacterized protein (TIGR02594 family)